MLQSNKGATAPADMTARELVDHGTSHLKIVTFTAGALHHILYELLRPA
jgi:hypothetical protein